MTIQEKKQLKAMIDQAKVISFDIFDTLLFRKTNTPEIIFDLVGKHFHIDGFRKLRMDEQNEASRRAYLSHQAPHADMDEIYAVLSEHTEIPVDWNAVKAYEIQMERDALTANVEMLEIFQYAKEQNKRVVVTSDMYLFAETLTDFLQTSGLAGFDCMYASADVHKYDKELFELVAQREGVAYEEILHIGDDAKGDGECPGSLGIQTYVYEWSGENDKVKNASGTDVDGGIYKILFNRERGFWYNLGVEVGGPMYMGLYRFVEEKIKNANRKIFFISGAGYNLYNIFKDKGYTNIEYLYISHRALTLACGCEMDEETIESFPPYNYGQTVGEILDDLCITRGSIKHLSEAGLKSFDQIIQDDDDIAAFKRLYQLDEAVFLVRCQQERDNAMQYLNSIGFFDEDAICFDCGWQGSSQDLIERFKKAAGCQVKHEFLYYGIKNCDDSRKYLGKRHYDTYLFDFYKNYSLQTDVNDNAVMFELFFSAPHARVAYYGENGELVYEDGSGDDNNPGLLSGIQDYFQMAFDFTQEYDVEYMPELSIGRLTRLIQMPTEEEAVQIGNLQHVDGFARRPGKIHYIAYVTQQDLAKGNKLEVYWLNGLLKRPDISEKLKTECAQRLGRQYLAVVPEYHLEDSESIRRYHRWLDVSGANTEEQPTLSYMPSFSVVIPVYNTVTEQLEECIESVLAQQYANYELILVDDHSSWANVVPVLQKYEQHPKVRVIYRQTNGHISEATNDGIRIAAGDFIVFMDCDDTIESIALYEFAKKLNENPELDFIYSDEDKITEDGMIRHMPFFKPDWSPDLFLNMMYTNHLATYRTQIVKEVGGLRTAYNGSQDYDFTLRFMEKSDNKRVGHVSRILYHWRERKESVAYAITSKNYASEAAKFAKYDYIRRNGLQASLEPVTGMSQYRIIYEVVGNPLVSIIIPSKDHPEILKQCVDSIREFTQYQNYEIIVVDNGSGAENRKKIQQYLDSVGAKYIYDACEFNYSYMCNCGAKHASGEYLLFLNDDVELFQPDWLNRMLGHAQQKHTGAVGAKLFYPNSTKLQHAGVSNPKTGPTHNFPAYDDQYPYYFGWNRVNNNCIAVTGACLLIAAEKFYEAGAFDETYPVAYNDVKLCFTLHELGYYNVIRNDVAAYHHESLSRGSDFLDQAKLDRLARELRKLYSQFPKLNDFDPYMNINLRGYAAVLDLKQQKNRPVPIDISGCIPAKHANLDAIQMDETELRIVGWSFLTGERHLEELERYLLFRDPYGNAYGVKLFALERADVAAFYQNGNYLYAGYDCVIDRNGLRVDLFSYEVGVMSITKAGLRFVCWCGQLPKSDAVVFDISKTEVKRLNTPVQLTDVSNVRWSLDECRGNEDGYRLAGFAFKKGNDHYHYQTTLLLSDGEDHTYEISIHPQKRLDVACAFPEEHYLYDTGFICQLHDGLIPGGKAYEVSICLTNRYYADEIYVIPTGQKIELS